CTDNSNRPGFLVLMDCAPSKFFTSAAILVGSLLTSKRVTGPAALTPRLTLPQNVARSLPLGEITPSPVMTTRLLPGPVFIMQTALGSSFYDSRFQKLLFT